MTETRPPLRRVIVLAEDLIWASRLASLVQRAGVEVKHAKTAPELDRGLVCADAVMVDLTARNYDPLAAIERSAQHGREIVGVGQHEDVAMRRRAFAAGASHVWTYNQVHAHGPALVGRWLGRG